MPRRRALEKCQFGGREIFVHADPLNVTERGICPAGAHNSRGDNDLKNQLLISRAKMETPGWKEGSQANYTFSCLIRFPFSNNLLWNEHFARNLIQEGITRYALHCEEKARNKLSLRKQNQHAVVQDGLEKASWRENQQRCPRNL